MAFVALLAAGCGVLHRSLETEDDLASRFLPTPRHVPHPDSLTSVRLVRTSGPNAALAIEMDTTYGALWERWSSGPRQGLDSYGSSSFFNHSTTPFSSFATLWGRELRMAAFDRMHDLTTRSPAEVDSLYQADVEDPHQAEIWIDVYMYVPYADGAGPRMTNLRTLGGQVRLRTDAGPHYTPTDIDPGPLQWRPRGDGPDMVYRHNRVVFDRFTEDGVDLFAEARLLELIARSSQPRSSIIFAWELPHHVLADR